MLLVILGLQIVAYRKSVATKNNRSIDSSLSTYFTNTLRREPSLKWMMIIPLVSADALIP